MKVAFFLVLLFFQGSLFSQNSVDIIGNTSKQRCFIKKLNFPTGDESVKIADLLFYQEPPNDIQRHYDNSALTSASYSCKNAQKLHNSMTVFSTSVFLKNGVQDVSFLPTETHVCWLSGISGSLNHHNTLVQVYAESNSGSTSNKWRIRVRKTDPNDSDNFLTGFISCGRRKGIPSDSGDFFHTSISIGKEFGESTQSTTVMKSSLTHECYLNGIGGQSQGATASVYANTNNEWVLDLRSFNSQKINDATPNPNKARSFTAYASCQEKQDLIVPNTVSDSGTEQPYQRDDLVSNKTVSDDKISYWLADRKHGSVSVLCPAFTTRFTATLVDPTNDENFVDITRFYQQDLTINDASKLEFNPDFFIQNRPEFSGWLFSDLQPTRDANFSGCYIPGHWSRVCRSVDNGFSFFGTGGEFVYRALIQRAYKFYVNDRIGQYSAIKPSKGNLLSCSNVASILTGRDVSFRYSSVSEGFPANLISLGTTYWESTF